MDKKTRLSFDYYRDKIEKSSNKILKLAIKEMKQKIDEIRKDYGIIAKKTDVLSIYNQLKDIQGGKYGLMPVYVHMTYFKPTNYARNFPFTKEFPPHAQLALDVSGDYFENQGQIEIFLLETVLYEDMAALVNRVVQESTANFSLTEENKARIKFLSSVRRASISAILSFVEACINGFAFEHYLTDDGKLKDEEIEILLDWDISKNTPKYMSLREKVIQYQRIILQRTHPIIQESNCPELKFILETAKTCRDALAHPSPGLKPFKPGLDKESPVHSLNTEIVLKAADSAVSLVRKLNGLFHDGKNRFSWLIDRSPDGFFPPDAFS